MSVITTVLIMLFAGLVVGLAAGSIILCIDRRRKRRTRKLNIKDGITVEYECSLPGIYESIREFLKGK